MRKKQIGIKCMAISLVMACSVLNFTGCSIGDNTPIIGNITGLKSNQMFKIDELVCSKSEYMICLLDTAKQYAKDFGGSVDWKNKISDHKTLEEFVKDKVKESITVKYALAAMAKKNNVTLSDTEKTEVSKQASQYYKAMTDTEKDYTDAKEADVENLCEKYKLAEKVYSGITEHVGDDISEEDARVIKIQYIKMDSSKTKVSKIKSTLNEVKSAVEGGYQEFSREAKQYSVDSTVEKDIKKSEATLKYETEAFNLTKGKISDIIEDGDSYYLVYCVNNYIKDKTTENKKDMVEKAKEAAFNEQYSKFIDRSKNQFNDKQWKKIELPSL